MISLSVADLMVLIGKWWWPFFRILAALWMMPFFGDNRITRPVRVLFAFLLSVLVTPLMPDMPRVDPFSLMALTLAFEQLIFGLMFGLCVTMLFTLMAMVGQILSMQMGLAMAVMNDPVNGGSAPIISQLTLIFATLLFLAFNGHLVVLDILIESFRSFPVGSGVSALDLEVVVNLFGWMFGAALILAMPAVIAMLLVNLTFGVMNRSAPSLNVFALGFPMSLLMGLMCIGLSIAGIPNRFLELTIYALDQMRVLVGG